ncbi:MAG: MFS transporter [Coriobacteriales bacterium]|jgi:CP family cyanate transporter-like MFS transporter|nr:MFS transporter [Coriobacteriales bacterium]
MKEEKLYPRRWAVLTGLTIILVALQFSFIVPGGAAALVFMNYGINPMQFSMVMSIPYLSGILFGILSGVLADRYGFNKVIVVGFAFALIGAIWRAFSGTSYLQLFISSFIMGIATAALNANSAKIVRTWFPGKSNSVAMGIYVAGLSGGAALALFYGSRVTVLTDAWFLSAGLIAVGIVAWLVLYRRHPDGDTQIQENISEYLGIVLKNKDVWGISIFAMLFFGMTNVNGQYCVAAMSALGGGDPAAILEAGSISTVNTVIGCICSIALPAVIAMFSRLRGPVIFCMVATGILFCLPYFLPFGLPTWIIYIILPVFFGPIMAITKMLPALLPSVKQEHLGAVGGVQSTFQNVGFFALASYVLSPIAMAVDPTGGLPYYQAIFVGVLVVCLLVAASLFLFPNVRTSVAAKIADDHAAAAAAGVSADAAPSAE